MNQELIKKLQDPDQAQPFYMRTKEEQDILKEAGVGNCLTTDLDIFPQWNEPNMPVSLWSVTCYILRPDYQPKPEYIDIAIVVDGGGELRLERSIPGRLGRGRIDILPGRKEFAGFYSTTQPNAIATEDVATLIREGFPVWARIVRE